METIKDVVDLAQSGAIRLTQNCILATYHESSDILRFYYRRSFLLASKDSIFQTVYELRTDLYVNNLR